jgi:hypothetical protein
MTNVTNFQRFSGEVSDQYLTPTGLRQIDAVWVNEYTVAFGGGDSSYFSFDVPAGYYPYKRPSKDCYEVVNNGVVLWFACKVSYVMFGQVFASVEDAMESNDFHPSSCKMTLAENANVLASEYEYDECE